MATPLHLLPDPLLGTIASFLNDSHRVSIQTVNLIGFPTEAIYKGFCQNISNLIETPEEKGNQRFTAFNPSILFQVNARVRSAIHSLNLTGMETIYSQRKMEVIFELLPNLRTISLSSVRFIASSHIYSLVEYCPRLEDLSLMCCRLGPKVFEAIGCLSQLRALDLSGCNNISATSLQPIIQGCRFLEKLTLNMCPQLSDQDIELFVQNFPHLKHLGLAAPESTLSDKAFEAIARHCPRLESLELAFPMAQSIEIIARGCHQLKTLKFMSCNELSDQTIRVIAENCPHLEHLYYLTWDALSDQAIYDLADHCPHLQDLCLTRESEKKFQAETIQTLYSSCRKLRQPSI